MSQQRYFRSSAAVYEAMRLQLDAAFGYPNGVTQTVWTPVGQAIRDAQGQCFLAVHAASCERPAVAGVLPSLLASGAVEEITAEQYHAVMAPSLQTAPASAFPAGTTTINGSLGGRTFGL